MLPTFKPGDGLQVEPYGARPIRVGDVVVFRHPSNSTEVVHRVVRIDRGKVTTRGDNNDQYDKERLSPEDIRGRVVAVLHPGGNTNPVVNGPAGLLLARVLWLRSRMLRAARKHLRPPYRWLTRSGPLKFLLPSDVKLRVVSFTSQRGVEKQLFAGQRCLARKRPRTEWQIYFPYRFFISARDIETLEAK